MWALSARWRAAIIIGDGLQAGALGMSRSSKQSTMKKPRSKPRTTSSAKPSQARRAKSPLQVLLGDKPLQKWFDKAPLTAVQRSLRGKSKGAKR